MESNDVLMLGGSGALVAAAYVGLGLPVALLALAVALIYFAHVLPSFPLRRRAPQPVPAPEPEPEPLFPTTSAAGGRPVVNATCFACNNTFVRGAPHECEAT